MAQAQQGLFAASATQAERFDACFAVSVAKAPSAY
jgi:hypothetical protein